jgi:hypothetical protein
MNVAMEAAERFTAVLASIATLTPADRLVLKFAAQEYAAALIQECARPAQWGSRPAAKDGAA